LHSPQDAADLSTDGFFWSLNSPNQSIGYDFKDNQAISPTNYAIGSVPSWPVNSDHPKSWVIEVTNDRSKANSWVEIDRREDNQDLNGGGIVGTFTISHRQSGGFRCIRFRQIGANHRGRHFFWHRRIRTVRRTPHPHSDPAIRADPDERTVVSVFCECREPSFRTIGESCGPMPPIWICAGLWLASRTKAVGDKW
jgi:hypothetical protein